MSEATLSCLAPLCFVRADSSNSLYRPPASPPSDNSHAEAKTIAVPAVHGAAAWSRNTGGRAATLQRGAAVEAVTVEAGSQSVAQRRLQLTETILSRRVTSPARNHLIAGHFRGQTVRYGVGG